MILRVLRISSIYILLSACSPQSDIAKHSFQVHEENGVTIAITSSIPKYDEPLFQYDEVVRLHQDEEQPESLLYRTTEFLMGDDGYFYVMDRGNTRVAVFNTYGLFVRSIGRDGEGPGEFRSPRLLWIRSGLVAVSDYQLQRTSLFKTDGLFVRSHSHQSGRSPMTTIYPTNDDRLVLIDSNYEITPNGESLRWYTAAVLDAQGNTLASLSSPRYIQSRQFVIEQYRLGSAGQVYFGPRSIIQYHDGLGLLCYHTAEPVLEWYGLNGEILRMIRVELEREPVTDEERRGIERGFQQSIDEAENEQLKAMFEGVRKHSVIPDWKSYWSSAIVDDSGHHWLRYHYDYTIKDDSKFQPRYRILSPEGEYLGDTQRPERGGTISYGHFLTSHEDEETGEEIYVVYRLVPVPEGFIYP